MIRRPLKSIELKKEDIKQELVELESRLSLSHGPLDSRSGITPIDGKSSADEVKTSSAIVAQIAAIGINRPSADSSEVRRRIGFQSPQRQPHAETDVFYTPR